MPFKKLCSYLGFLAFASVTLFMPLEPAPALAQSGEVVVGVNSWNVASSQEAQEAALNKLAKDGVKVIRLGVFLSGDSLDYVARAYQHGISTIIIVWPWTGSKAKAKDGVWSRITLSELNPQDFGQAMRQLVDKLEAAGVRLTALELGNEINTSRFNGDIPSPGSGRVLGLSDLNNPSDAEAKGIVASYKNYLELVAALKDVRDHSKLNQRTPVIAAGLAEWGQPSPQAWDKKLGVSVPDTIKYFRQIGMDKLVDGYGVHIYPSGNPTITPEKDIASFDKSIFAACTSAKPCWLTEWGIPNNSKACPIDDKMRMQPIKNLREAYEHFIQQGRLAAVIYYDWNWAQDQTKQEPFSIYRCNALTEAGRLALAPM